MKLYYIKFSELHKKPKVGETPSLVWAFIADSDSKALKLANDVGNDAKIMSSHQLSHHWK